MICEFEIFPEQRIVLVRYRGEVTAADLIEGTRALWADPRYDPRFEGIVDLSDHRLRASTDDFRAYLDFLVEQPKTSTARWAAVATTPLATAFGLLYQRALARRHPFGVYSGWAAACASLRLAPTPAMTAWMRQGEAEVI